MSPSWRVLEDDSIGVRGAELVAGTVWLGKPRAAHA